MAMLAAARGRSFRFGRSDFGPVGLIRIGEVVRAIPVVMPDPFHGEREVSFVAAFGDHIENHVGADQRTEAPSVSGISVKNVAGFVLVKDAKAGSFLAWEFLKRVRRGRNAW